MTVFELDGTDRRILASLYGDARNVTTAEIGAELDVSGSTVANRISQLEDSGVIAGYAPLIDYEVCGLPQHHLFVATVAGPDRQASLAEIGDLAGVVGVTELLADRDNVLVEVVGERPADLEAVATSLSDLGVELDRTAVVTDVVRRAFDCGRLQRSNGESFDP